MTVQTVSALSVGLDAAADVVAAISVEQLGLPTPCPGWSVREVINHLAGVTTRFTEFADGRTDSPQIPSGDLLAADHRRAIAEVVASSHAAWRSADLSRTCHLGFGSYPAPVAAGINLFDAVAHAWDVATAAGVELDCPDDVWEVALQAARVVVSPRDPRHYGPERTAPPNATPAARLLAFLGRAP